MFPALLLRYLNLYLNFSGYVAGLECASEEAGEWFREKIRTVYSALVIVVVGVGLSPARARSSARRRRRSRRRARAGDAVSLGRYWYCVFVRLCWRGLVEMLDH